MPDTDPLYPLNWHQFCDQLSLAIDEANAEGRNLALIGVRLKQFYLFSARHGIEGGEDLVKRAFGKLEGALNKIAFIHRVSPDTIALVIPHVKMPELLVVGAKRIVDQLAATGPDDEALSIEASVAVALFPDHGHDASSLLGELNLGLRRNEKHSVSYHVAKTPEMSSHIQRLEMRRQLRSAISNQDLELVYQPKIDLKTLRPVSCEALMRWILPDGKIVRPQEFIPAAEASGQIHRLAEWAIHTAMREAMEWPDSCSVAVNVSATSIYDPDFVDTIRSALAIWGLPPERLIIELTETLLMSDTELCFRQLSRIRDMGVKIAIDDFGTGFSSLSYFKTIPADELKIDQSFVIGMKNNEDDEKIVALIIELAHKFGLRVVAEGIESRQVLVRLQELGCDVGQGFYLAKPMVIGNFNNWMSRFSPGGELASE